MELSKRSWLQRRLTATGERFSRAATRSLGGDSAVPPDLLLDLEEALAIYAQELLQQYRAVGTRDK